MPLLDHVMCCVCLRSCCRNTLN
eukprot:COSAG06_NODE_62266_length_265_cov_0.939759_1_plen_22_part_01